MHLHHAWHCQPQRGTKSTKGFRESGVPFVPLCGYIFSVIQLEIGSADLLFFARTSNSPTHFGGQLALIIYTYQGVCKHRS